MSHNDSKDYYGVLELHKGATDIEIKKSYRKMAMKHHPDKNLGASMEAECKFQEVGEAYDVLSDKEKRAIFDQYGYEGLKDGVDCRNGRKFSLCMHASLKANLYAYISKFYLW